MVELRRKWNKLCHSLHPGRHTQSHFSSTLYNNQSLLGKSYSFASTYPWWPSQSSIFPESNSITFTESALKPNNSTHSVAKFRRQQSCTIEFNFGNCTQKIQEGEPSLDSLKSSEGKEVKITLALGNCELSDATKLGKEKSETIMKRSDLFQVLQENVPWQSDSIPSIVEALMECKKGGTWFLIQGNDTIGKRRLAFAIAESVFGSADFLFHLNMRKRNDDITSFSEMLTGKLKHYEKLVVLVEEVDLADAQFMKLLADGFETVKFGEPREVNIGQVIFILTKGDSNEDKDKNQDSVINMTLKIEEVNHGIDHKRKAEWDFSKKIKNPRIGEKEDANPVATGNVNSKKDFSRQSSFSTLDLNMKADEDDESEEKAGDISPISSDITGETSVNPPHSNGFLDLIQNRLIFNRNSSKDGEITRVFLTKFNKSFGEVFRGQNRVNFIIEERVMEEMLIGSGFLVNSLFEKWLKEVFQTSLEAVKIGGKEEGIEIRLCFGGKNQKVSENYGFGDSCLPKKIQITMIG